MYRKTQARCLTDLKKNEETDSGGSEMVEERPMEQSLSTESDSKEKSSPPESQSGYRHRVPQMKVKLELVT